MESKPIVKLTDHDGNAFAIMGSSKKKQWRISQGIILKLSSSLKRRAASTH